MGGYGTWALAARRPDLFAAAVPVCGGGNRAEAAWLRSVPAWAFHGAKDDVVPVSEGEAMVRALERAGGEARLTVYPDAGHDSWTRAYDDPEVFAWLLEHRRRRA
jgi:predicted peptidase